jgi:hypothetical protein
MASCERRRILGGDWSFFSLVLHCYFSVVCVCARLAETDFVSNWVCDEDVLSYEDDDAKLCICVVWSA